MVGGEEGPPMEEFNPNVVIDMWFSLKFVIWQLRLISQNVNKKKKVPVVVM